MMESLESRRLLAVVNNNLARGDEVLEYRIAIATTAEYTDMVGGVSAAQQSIENLVSALNDLFTRELGIRFDLVSGTNLIFTDPSSDGYTNSSASAMLAENQSIVTSVIGSANFDIGHVLGSRASAASGVASLGVVGRDSFKARGVTTVSGDALNWLDVVAHEIGHQFDAEHTFNGTDGNCTATNRSSTSAYEPGSGSTLMSYFGSCGVDNLPGPEEFVFHADSFEDIHTYITSITDAQPFSTTSLNNQIPVVDAGPDYVIPARTPFQLTAVGSDADVGDTLTYSWEQLDLGPAAKHRDGLE